MNSRSIVDNFDSIYETINSFMPIVNHSIYEKLECEYYFVAYMNKNYTKLLAQFMDTIGVKTKSVGLIMQSYESDEFDCMDIYECMKCAHSKEDYNIDKVTILEYDSIIDEIYLTIIRKNKYTKLNDLISISIK